MHQLTLLAQSTAGRSRTKAAAGPRAASRDRPERRKKKKIIEKSMDHLLSTTSSEHESSEAVRATPATTGRPTSRPRTNSDPRRTRSKADDEAVQSMFLSRPCGPPSRTRGQRDLSRVKRAELAEMLFKEQESEIPPSFFLVAAACCHAILLIGLLLTSQAPAIVLIAPTLVSGGLAAHKRPQVCGDPRSTLFFLFGVQAVMVSTWMLHSHYSV